ncbi:hypothetical protein JCM16303_005859 [Sporobolomyces ruberrimus]
MDTPRPDTVESVTSPFSPSTPRAPPRFSNLNQFGSSTYASSPLAAHEASLDLSIEKGTIHSRRNSSKDKKNRPSPDSSEENSSIVTIGGLTETEIGIQAGTIGGGFGPYPSLSVLSSIPPSDRHRRALHHNGSDSAVDLFASPDHTPLASPSIHYSPSRSAPKPLETYTTNTLPYLPGSGGSTPTRARPSPAVDLDFPVSPLYLSNHKFLQYSHHAELDDYLYDEDELYALHRRYNQSWKRKTFFEYLNALALFVVVAALLFLMLIYPILRYGVLGSWSTPHRGGVKELGWGLGGINASGQVPVVVVPSLVDPDTPQDARTRRGSDGETYNLVSSDEFNRDGRTFWPGDDPFWVAVDLHYWQTQDYEWYDPDAITTKNGKLEITLSQEPIHDLNFRSGMLQSWNKLCFQGGIIEVSMSSPGNPETMGFWPGTLSCVWTLGNLGRAGFGATNDGVWPYSYDSCDVGTLPNQSFSNHTPTAAHESGLRDYGGQLSWLRGQRLSACTCQGEDHPGPDVTVGRGAPEIDLTEQQVDWRGIGSTSQSIQFAPMDAGYLWLNETPHTTIFDPNRTFQNTFQGATFQESASVITLTDTTSYDGNGYTRYGFEYSPGPDGQITWFVNDTSSWRILASAIGPNEETQIGQRLISEEPMSITINLAISKAFQTPNWANLTFPGVLRVDYIRLYQKGSPKLGCDPPDHPTSAYINRHMEIYTNPNLTTFQDQFPRNRLSDEGCL